MIEIEDIFESVLNDARSLDMAESIFKCMLLDDSDLKVAYRRWCSEQGTTEKHGFVDYCSERFDEEEQFWNTLNDEDYE
ncbi:MAG: hypothetical protein NC402_06955 [Prevotella sp.]|nr:hypothetical protein [Prevotella sp.]MCM1075516.1 hypothetical protein [Ruminococcus sp.]